MNTNDQTNTVLTMQSALRRRTITATSMILMMGAASAQMAPVLPTPVLTPAVPAAAAAAAAMPRSASPYEVVFKRIDSDGNGFISKAELEKADAKLGEDFQKYDLDGDGKLSMAEFETMMRSTRSQ